MKNVFEVTRLGVQGAVGRVAVTREGLRTEIAFVGGVADGEIYRLAAVCGGRYVPLGVAAPLPEADETDEGARLSFRRLYTPNALREIGFSEPQAFVLATSEELARAETIASETPAIETTTQEPDAQETAAVEVAHETIIAAEPTLAAAPTLVAEPTLAVVAEPVTHETTIAAEPAAVAHDFAPCADAASLFTQPELYGTIATETAQSGALVRVSGEVAELAVPLREGEPFAPSSLFFFGEPLRLDGRDYLVFKLKNGVLFA